MNLNRTKQYRDAARQVVRPRPAGKRVVDDAYQNKWRAAQARPAGRGRTICPHLAWAGLARPIQRWALTTALWLTVTAPMWAQCAMCKANIAHAQNAAEVAPTVNAAVLVLLIPTLLVIGGLVKLVLKYRHAPSDNTYVNLRSADAQRDSQ